MIWWIVGGVVASIAAKMLLDDSSSQPGVKYRVGQKVRIPLNQFPNPQIPPSMMAAFQQTDTSDVIVSLTSITPTVASGNLIATVGPTNGQILMPVPVPVTFPTSIIASGA